MGTGPQFQHKTGAPRHWDGLRGGGWRQDRKAATFDDGARGPRRPARPANGFVLSCGRGIGHEIAVALLGLAVRGGTIVFLVGVDGDGRAAVAFLQGTAGLFPAAGLRAGGDDARARLRRLAACRICQRAPALHADPGGAEARHQRLHRGRGQELLRAQRPRLPGHRARARALRAELRQRPPPAGRLHHHPAGRQELPADERAVAGRARSRKRCWR